MVYNIVKTATAEGVRIIMRVLQDISCFTNRKAKIFHASSRFIGAEDGIGSHKKVVQLPAKISDIATVYCSYAGNSDLTGFFFQRRLRQDFLSLEYVLSGELRIRSGCRGYIAEPGDLCLLHPGLKHDLLFEAATPCRLVGFCLEGPHLVDLLTMFELDNVDTIPFPDGTAILRFCSQIQTLLRSPFCQYAMARNAGWCFTFLEVISSSMKKQAANDIFARLADYFKQNFTEKLDMREVASLFSVNLDEMNLTFRTQFGITPYQYLIRLRMSHAAALLRNSRHAIKEIAAMVGYNHPLYFSGEFYKHYGCSPKEYRKQNYES